MRPAELKELRQQLGWSQQEAAARLDLSFRSYRYTEDGTNAHGKAITEVPRPLALSMLAFTLAVELEVGFVSPDRLADFCKSVLAPAVPTSRMSFAARREPPRRGRKKAGTTTRAGAAPPAPPTSTEGDTHDDDA